MSVVGKDPANIQAAQQDAEQRRLKRKQSIRGKSGTESGGGVAFDEAPSEASEIAPSSTPIAAPVTSSEDTQQVEGTREIKIISDGTFAGTQIFVDGKETRTSDMKIFLSKTSGFVCKITQEVDLFRS